MNKDDGKHVKTKFWLPMMLDLHKKEREEPEIRERRRIRRARQQGQEEQGEREESINMTSNRNDTMIEPETEFI